MDEYSCKILIIGAGPAGLSAGVYCGRAGSDTIILEGKEPSALETAKEVWNYPGYIKLEGPKLLQKFRTHAESHESVRIIKGDVISLLMGMGTNMVSTRTANITADVVIIATGRGVRREQIKGEEVLNGHGVSYCALCDGPLYKERIVYLYGHDDEVLEEALILKQMGVITNIITNGDFNEFPEKKQEVVDAEIPILEKTEIVEIIGSSQGVIEKILYKKIDSEDIEEQELSCLFVLSHVPSNSIFKKSGIKVNDSGFIEIDNEQQTNIKGVFAAGDVTGGLYQVVFATAEGARAGIAANKYIRSLKKE